MPNLTDEVTTAKERRLNLQRDSETFLRLFYYKLYFFGDNYNVRICEMYQCIFSIIHAQNAFRVFPSLPKTTFTARSCAVS